MNILLNGISADIENCNFERIEIYKNILKLLNEIFNDECLENLEDLLDELEGNAEAYYTYQAIKEDIVGNDDDDESLYDTIAWKFGFCKKNIDKK